MQVAHPASRHAAQASVTGGADHARLAEIDELRAQPVRCLAKLAEGE